MENIYYVGLDIHKKMIAWCLKDHTGYILKQGEVKAARPALQEWVANLPQPWVAAMEATLFTGWVYDFLLPHARDLKVAHPEMLKAITFAKKKNDQADAECIADLLRVGLLPECYMAPREIRKLRRVLRFRNLLVRQAVRMKNIFRNYPNNNSNSEDVFGGQSSIINHRPCIPLQRGVAIMIKQCLSINETRE